MNGNLFCTNIVVIALNTFNGAVKREIMVQRVLTIWQITIEMSRFTVFSIQQNALMLFVIFAGWR